MDRHLRDLDFIDPDDAPQGDAVCRGAVVRQKRKPGRSGTRGNVNRKSQVKRGLLKRGTKDWRRLKRGINVKERRAVEQSRRAPRPRAMRAMRAASA